MEHQASSSKKVKELQARIQELEAMVGRKQITIDYLEKLIELAQDDLGVDIKKNSSTPRSDGFNSTSKKGGFQ